MSWLSERLKFKSFFKMRDAKKAAKKITELTEDTGISDALEGLTATIVDAEALEAIAGLKTLMQEIERDDIDDDTRQQANEFVRVVIDYFKLEIAVL